MKDLINQRRSYYPNQSIARFFENKVSSTADNIQKDFFTLLDPNRYLFASHPRENAGSAHPGLISYFLVGVFIFLLFKFRPNYKKSFLKISLVPIFIILLLALFLRTVNLSSVPLGLYVDDAAISYNAYSLGLSGRDEYGQPFPIFLRSFGDYKSPLATYLAVLPIKIFGLSITAVRLVPAVIGTLTVLAFAILAYRLTPRAKPAAFLISSILMALSPLHMFFSRGFYESTLSILLFSTGMVSVLRKHASLGLFFLSLAAYSYHPLRLTVYLFLFGLVVLPRKKFSTRHLIIFFITQIPLFYLSFADGPAARFRSLSWVNNLSFSDWPREFVSQYLAYYSPQNLFYLPDPDPQRSLPELSLAYPWQVAPFLLGLILVFKSWRQHRELLLLLVVSPVAAALTKDPFSTLRASLILLPVNLIITQGLLPFVTRKWHLALLLTISLPVLYRSLFILQPVERAHYWNYGYQELFSRLSTSNLPAVIDADKPVYALYLFYQKISPDYVQSISPKNTDYYSQTDWSDYYQDSHVRFGKLVWEKDMYTPQLIAGDPLLISPNQASEHFLTPEFAIEDFLEVHRTHPDLKCANVLQNAKINPCSR